MKFTHYIYITSLALLAACSDNSELTGTDDSHPNGTIELTAGIVEGGSSVTTRATGDNEQDDHSKHLTLTTGTALGLYVSGTWTNHDPGTVVQNTTAAVGAETTEGTPATATKHNSLTTDPVLYWDDYGTADPANESTGRAEGLTIYGVAINGKTTIPTDLTTLCASNTLADWQALSWTLAADQSSNWSDKDLLISNNVQGTATTGKEYDTGTYKFTERESGKLLEFRHALSKITVNLKAGDGFDDDETTDEAGIQKFSTDPYVWLTGDEGDVTVKTHAWAYKEGTVDITTGTVTKKAATTDVITMCSSGTPPSGYQVAKEALVFPGSAFASDDAIIARINADGNIYYVKAKEIRDAIDAKFSTTTAASTPLETRPGYNYVINVRINKTAINVTATVADWTKVNAEEVAPIINITANFPNPIVSRFRYDQFSFYRSLWSDDGHINDGYSFGDDANLIENGFYKPESRITHTSLSMWEWSQQRYWSNHNQHYQFRLVWPRTTTATKAADPNHPHVERKQYPGSSTYYQVIEIFNEPYEALYSTTSGDLSLIVDDNTHHPYPSNLMIARPEFVDDPATVDVDESDPICENNETGHTHKHLYSEGICAREGNIVLTFRYVMSQVEVNLTTTSTASSVDLAGATVEITNIYSTGDVKLGDREVIQTGEKGSYTVNPVEVVADDAATTDVDEKTVSENKRHSAIVPQPLTFGVARASTNVQFKVTLANGDVYYADVQPIPVLEAGSPNPATPVNAWESGKHYIYTLNISKTAIRATATLEDWKKVTANEEVWF